MNRTPSSRPSPPVGEKVPGGRLRGFPTVSWPRFASKFWRFLLSMTGVTAPMRAQNGYPGVVSPQPEATVRAPDLRADVGPHAGDAFPGDRAVEQADIATLCPDGSGRLLIGRRVRFEVEFVPDDGATRGVRRQDALETVGIHVQVGHENQGRVFGRFLGGNPGVGNAS